MTWTRSLLILGVLVAAGPTQAQPAQPTAPAAQGPSSIEGSRRALLQGVETIGDLTEDAKKDQDMPRLNCLTEIQVDSDKVTELATAEYLRARNPTADAFERVLAREKLSAAADTMGELVDQAKGCTFASSDDDPTMTRNASDEETAITINDPTTVPVVTPTAPPILDPAWLPTASGLL